MLLGPNSPVGNFSVIAAAEAQAGYILQCIGEKIRHGAIAIAPSIAATESFNKELVEAMKGSIWLTGCQSWYLDADGNPVTWPRTPFQNRVLSCLNFCNGTVPHTLKIKPLREGDTACVSGGMAMSAR
jgi:hypothetical protein